MARRALLTLAVLTLCGCWKRDDVVQPKLDFEVRDAAGPISGAKVRLLTSTDPHHRREALVDVVTDARRVYPSGSIEVQLQSSTSDERCIESGGDFSVVK